MRIKGKEKDHKKECPSDSPVNNVTIGMGQSAAVQIHGEAASQIIQAYSGKRYDSSGVDLNHQGRSLKNIANYKVNADPGTAAKNIKQQSGFSAELLEEANQNHDAVLQGNHVRRRTTDGIGQTNNPQYDHVSVDEQGNIFDPSQMKFLGVDKKGRYSVIEKLAKDKSWDRYDCPIDVPKDQFEKAKAYAKAEAEKHLTNAENLRNRGNTEKAIAEEALAKKYKEAGERIRPSSVTESEALQARVNPKKYVAKTLLKDAHQAGKNAAQGAILVSGSISLVHNICSLNSGEITAEEAAENVVKSTVQAGATAYAVGSAGSTLKAIMHNSQHQAIRQLSNTSLPTMAVTSAVEISSVVREYASGNLTETEAMSRLGKSGTGTLAASYGAAVGTIFLGPGVGTMLGSMVGYMVSSSIYDSCLQILAEADIARENYERTKELCSAAILAMKQQREEFEDQVKAMLDQRQETIDIAIPEIMNSIDTADTDNFTDALSSLVAAFNQQLQFKSFEEFDSFMSNSSETFVF